MSKNTDKVDVESAEAQRCKVLGDQIHVARTALSLGLHELEALKAHFAVGTIGVNVDGTNAEGRPVLSSYADFLVRELLDRLPDLITALQADERRWEEMSERVLIKLDQPGSSGQTFLTGPTLPSHPSTQPRQPERSIG